MRSIDTSSKPAARAQPTTSRACRGVAARSRAASRWGRNDCTPTDSRVTPIARRAASAWRLTVSGLASMLTSAPSARAGAHRVQQAGEAARAHQGRGPAAEVDRLEGPEARRLALQLGEQRVGVRVPERERAGLDDEGAVPAARGAEGQVHVEVADPVSPADPARRRRFAAPPGTPPAAPRRCRSASYASCPPSVSRAACACG